MPTVDLVYFNAGGGHRAAAQAIESVVSAQRRPWRVRLVNVIDVLDPEQRFRSVTGMAPEDFYNKRLSSGFTAGLAQELKILQGILRLAHRPMVQRLAEHWRRARPDLVVSLIPNFNRAVHASVREARPGTPYLTVITDLADHPPSFWIHPGPGQWYACGTDRAVEQALAVGCAPEQVVRTSGMVLRPTFHEPMPIERAAERQALGLDPRTPVGLVLFGGHGSPAMVSIARQLPEVPLILMCGHNDALVQRLRRLPAAAPRSVVGFTPQVRRYMELADFFIGKPGPGSLSEALHVGLPVVTVRNRWTMPQERYNTDWVRQHGVGIVTDSTARIRDPVLQLISRLPEFQACVGRLPPNRAVFEVVELMARLLARRAGRTTQAHVTAVRDLQRRPIHHDESA